MVMYKIDRRREGVSKNRSPERTQHSIKFKLCLLNIKWKLYVDEKNCFGQLVALSTLSAESINSLIKNLNLL